MLVREGTVEVDVPEQEGPGKSDAVFFNPDMELNRDITVAALDAYRERRPDAATYLDATAATGIRGVRAAANGWRASMADVDPDAVERCAANLERNGLEGETHHRDANALLYDSTGYDVVDLDPFGTPMPFAEAVLRNSRGLVCVTATDTAPLCGAHFKSGVRKYDAIPRNTEYHAEMGLRVLLSALARVAARHDIGVTPVLSHVSDHYVRTYLTLSNSATAANNCLESLGYLHHCPECLWREHGYGRTVPDCDACPNCGSDQVLEAGPLWLDATHDGEFAQSTREHLTEEMGTADRAERLLDRVGAELDTPTHYDQHRLYGRWGEPAVGMDEYLGALREAGFSASRTHYGGTTFKTDATVSEMAALAASSATL